MSSESGMILTSLKMLFALGAVLAILLFVYYFAKKIMNTGKLHYKDKLIRVLACNYIGVKKNISIVEVAGSILVLGITNDNIRLLTKIEDKEMIEKLFAGDASDKPASGIFNKILLRVKEEKKYKSDS